MKLTKGSGATDIWAPSISIEFAGLGSANQPTADRERAEPAFDSHSGVGGKSTSHF
jgi:hypothetical protein